MSVNPKRTYTPKVRAEKVKSWQSSGIELESLELLRSDHLSYDRWTTSSYCLLRLLLMEFSPSKVLTAHAEGLIEFSQHLLMRWQMCNWSTQYLLCSVWRGM